MREHLIPVINRLNKIDSVAARKVANILMDDEIEEIFLGYLEKDAKNSLNLRGDVKIFLKKKYALHMDNSGHLTGKRYGRNGHDDTFPLRAEEIAEIPDIIKNVRQHEIIDRGMNRQCHRYRIIKIRNNSSMSVMIEVPENKKRVDIVTAHHISNQQVLKILRKKRDLHNRKSLIG